MRRTLGYEKKLIFRYSKIITVIADNNLNKFRFNEK